MLEPKSSQVFLIDLDNTVVNSSAEYQRWEGICKELSCLHYLGTGHPWCSLGAKLSCTRSAEFRTRGIFGKEAVLGFPPIKAARRAIRKMTQAFYVSGREESLRGATLDWLGKHEFPMFRLYLRADHDVRSISQVKKEIYQVIRLIHGKPSQEFIVLDDSESLASVCQELGMTFIKAPECFGVRERLT